MVIDVTSFQSCLHPKVIDRDRVFALPNLLVGAVLDRRIGTEARLE